jgi:F-type H+-transporting ATPase subunit a
MLTTFILAAENPVDHVVNNGWKTGDLFGMHGVWIWSSHVGTLLLAGLLTLLVLWWAAGKIATGPKDLGSERYVTRNPFAHAVEVICTYLRDETAAPLLGARTKQFMPFLWTIFFFILINNLLGLVPFTDITHVADIMLGYEHGKGFTGLIGATATQNIFVTAALAILTALVINFAGIRELGLVGYLKHLTAGTPFYLWPLMIPIEIIGTVIKPVALALRLFANMTAGHILVAVLFMFAVQGIGMLSSGGLGVVMGGGISLVSVVAAIAIYFLELFVAFLQAFVFMFLTTVFISQLSHHDEHEHHEGHDHEHAHA